MARGTTLVLLLGLAMSLSSRAVFRLDMDAGGWLLWGWLLVVPMALATVGTVPRGRLLLHLAVLGTVLGVERWTAARALYHVEVEVDSPLGPWNIARSEPRIAPSADAARVPLRVVDDTPTGLRLERDSVRIRWNGPTGTAEQVASLKACYGKRGRGLAEERRTPLALWILAGALLATLTDALLRWRPWRSGLLHLLGHPVHATAGWVVAGLCLAALKKAPDRWLGNAWITRGDDWYYLARGVGSILEGNLFLNPMPDTTEFWSFGYMYVVALVQLLSGPALWAVYAVQQSYHYLLPAALVLLLPKGQGLPMLTVAFGGILFVEADLNWQYGWLLMGDTLALPLLLGLLAGLVRGMPAWGTGLLSGLLFLARPEFLPIGALAAWAVAGRAGDGRRGAWRHILPWAVCVGLYVLRKWVVHGDLLPLPPHAQAGRPWDIAEPFFTQRFTDQVAGLLGWYPALNPEMPVRWHWLPIHLAFLVAVVTASAKRWWDRPMLFAVGAWVIVLAGRLVAPSVALYGHRHSLALVVLELAVVVLVLGRAWPLTTTGERVSGPAAAP
jgi:hypothetical protein